MSYLKIKNPESVDVRTIYRGQEYTILAGETKTLPEDVVNFVLEVYGFLSLEEKEEKKEEVEEVQIKTSEQKLKTKKK